MSSDFYIIKQYLRRAVSRPAFWKGVDLARKAEAVRTLNTLDNNEHHWQAWTDKWLNDEQKQKLNASVRKSRLRLKGKDITISNEAHRMLVALSDKGKLSFSQVIETRLKRAYSRHLKKSEVD